MTRLLTPFSLQQVVPTLVAGLIGMMFASQARGASTTPAAKTEAATLSDFKIIAERNIFNPKRTARSDSPRREVTRTRRTETLVLTGTMSYAKGTFAFFDGSSSRFRKVIDGNGDIADLKVAKIEPQFVLLDAGTNQLKLPVGYQLQKYEDGPWHLNGQSELASGSGPAPEAPAPRPQTAQSSSVSSSSNNNPEGASEILSRIIENALGEGAPPPPPQAEPSMPEPGIPSQSTPTSNDSQEEILRRLMQRRQQEMN